METKESKSWLERRTRLEKFFFVAFFIIIIVIVLFIIGLTCEQTGGCKAEEPKEIKSKSCKTQGCIQAANEILRGMDTSVDPCDDFYEFACGNQIKRMVIPSDQQYLDIFSIIQDTVKEQLHTVLRKAPEEGDSTSTSLAKKFFKACLNRGKINEQGTKIFQDLIRDVGGWPVLDEDAWNEEEFSWMQLNSKFRGKGLDTGYFVKFSVTTDTKNSSIRSIELDQPSDFGLAREFLIDGLYVDIYKQLMVNVAVELGANRTYAEDELDESLKFETELAKAALPREMRRNYTQLHNPMTIKELQEKYPKSGDWLKYLNSLLPKEVQRTENDIVVIVVPKYLAEFENLINNSTKRQQANFGIWRVMQDLLKYGSDNLYEHFLAALRDITKEDNEKSARWKVCVKETSEDLSYAVSSMYVREYFDEDAKKTAENMTSYIKATFKSLLNDLDWMDDKTRKKALSKANKIGEHVGYPDELKNDTILDDYYEKLEVDENEYLYSYLNICIHAADLVYKRLTEPVDKNDWRSHGEAYEVGAYYLPSQNNIQLPAGILQGIFFNKDRPAYLNFGAIGSIIGHEITHGFDDQGRQLDEDGSLKNWWEASTEQKFLDKTQCIIDQYNNYTVQEINEHINGITTQGENIADNGGIKQAYLAYQSWEKDNGEEKKLVGLEYNPHQLFWISAAMNWCTKYQKQYLETAVKTDNHSLNRFRVLGPFSNSKEFASAFNCTEGSNMNPVKKCAVW